MAGKSFGGTIKLQGESEYQKALRGISDNLKVLNSEMKAVTSQYDSNDASAENLAQQNEILNRKWEEQVAKAHLLAQALQDAQRETGENSDTTKRWQVELNNAQAEVNKLNRELTDNKTKLADATAKEASLANQSQSTGSSLKNLAKTLLECGAGSKDLGTVIKGNLSNNLDSLKGSISENVGKVKSFASGVSSVVGDMKQMGIVAGLSVAALKLFKEEMDDTGEETEDTAEAEKEAQKETLKLGDIIKANLISQGIVAGVKALGSAMKSIGSALFDVGKQAVQQYAEYEQLVGGVDTLFGESSKKVQEYASNAYKTSGLNANEYMETVTSFSASLLQSLNGDTAKSADVANMAIIDMSDNANKMGTSMESIQNAYQGFAKQNYTMLDNLKLGYGGTKEEMQRLLADASKLSGQKYDISNLNDVYEAIHVVQQEMGITGSTALEASTTISGSTGSMKAAWENLVTGIADDNADFDQLVNNLVVSLVGDGEGGGFLNNMLPRIKTAMDGVVKMVVSLTESLLPQIMEMAVDLINTLVTGINENLPALLESASTILTTLITGIVTIMPTLVPVAMQMLTTFITAILESLPMILEAGIQMLVSLAEGITDTLPDLIPLAINAVLNLVDTVLDNIDLIIETGIELIIALADGLLEALPDLIAKIPTIIDKLIKAIMNNFPLILDAGIKILLALTDGLIKAIPQLLASLPVIIGQLINGLLNAIPQLISAGGQLLSGLFKGFLDPTAIWNAVKSLFNGILGGLKSLFGIHSPSTVMADVVGKNLALGLGDGFEDTMSDVTKDMAGAIPTEFDTDISANLNAVGNSQGSTYEMMVAAFKQALTEVKVVMNGREMGAFVTNTIERAVFA